MAVHDAKTTYGHCKNLIKLFETLIDPIFPIIGSVVLEEPRGTYASRKQMIPASHLRIHKPKSSRSHRFISRSAEASIVLISQIIPQKQTLVNKNACPLFVLPTQITELHKRSAVADSHQTACLTIAGRPTNFSVGGRDRGWIKGHFLGY
jgi:hypothetical protein